MNMRCASHYACRLLAGFFLILLLSNCSTSRDLTVYYDKAIEPGSIQGCINRHSVTLNDEQINPSSSYFFKAITPVENALKKHGFNIISHTQDCPYYYDIAVTEDTQTTKHWRNIYETRHKKTGSFKATTYSTSAKNTFGRFIEGNIIWDHQFNQGVMTGHLKSYGGRHVPVRGTIHYREGSYGQIFLQLMDGSGLSLTGEVSPPSKVGLEKEMDIALYTPNGEKYSGKASIDLEEIVVGKKPFYIQNGLYEVGIRIVERATGTIIFQARASHSGAVNDLGNVLRDLCREAMKTLKNKSFKEGTKRSVTVYEK